VEKQKGGREELIKVVDMLWEEDKRSATEGFKRPIEIHLSSKWKIMVYKNLREKVADRAKKREGEARR
jgi:hypothetical protein